MEALRGHTSGYAIPTYAVDLPGGGGKVPVLPNYLISHSQDRAVFRNFEGYISTYVEPENYQRPKRTRWTGQATEEPGQKGVSSLLAGESMVIKPDNWTGTHLRGRDSMATNEAVEASAEDVKRARDVEIAPEGDEPVWAQIN
jgi:lysine 2,3-aminomutase